MPGIVEKPGCILLDVQIPGLSGPELQDRLSEIGSILPIVFVTGHADTPTTVRAIKAGAEDFLTKPVSSEQLIDAIERALAHYASAHDQRSRDDSRLALVATLTPRERQVFELIVRGKINKQIAYRAWDDRAHREGAPPPGDGEDASEFARGTGVDRGTARHACFGPCCGHIVDIPHRARFDNEPVPRQYESLLTELRSCCALSLAEQIS